MIDDEVNDQINRRIEESRLRDDLDLADPTALFEEADKERETIRGAAQAGLPDFQSNPNAQQGLKPITSVVASPPLSASVSDGILALNFDSTSPMQQARSPGGGGGTGGATVRMIFLNDGAEETYDVPATQV